MHRSNLNNMRDQLKCALFFFTMATYGQNIVTKDSVQKLKTVYILTKNKSISRFKDVENKRFLLAKKMKLSTSRLHLQILQQTILARHLPKFLTLAFGKAMVRAFKSTLPFVA